MSDRRCIVYRNVDGDPYDCVHTFGHTGKHEFLIGGRLISGDLSSEQFSQAIPAPATPEPVEDVEKWLEEWIWKCKTCDASITPELFIFIAGILRDFAAAQRGKPKPESL